MLTYAVKKKRPAAPSRGRRVTPAGVTGPSWQAHQANVRHILRGPTVQPKLTIGAPNDVYEQEADRVADEVLRMPEPRHDQTSPLRNSAPRFSGSVPSARTISSANLSRKKRNSSRPRPRVATCPNPRRIRSKELPLCMVEARRCRAGFVRFSRGAWDMTSLPYGFIPAETPRGRPRL